MNINYLTIEEFHEWDEFVSLHNQGTIFHTSLWLRNQAGEFNILTVKEDSTIVGGFAYVVSKKAGVKGIFKPPYTPYYHPIIRKSSTGGNSQKEIEILEQLLDQIKKYNVSLIFNSDVLYFFPYQNNGFRVQPKLNYTLQPEIFYESISKRKRSTINKYKRSLASGNFQIQEDRDVKDILEIWVKFGKEKSINAYASFLEKVFLNNKNFKNWNCLKIINSENQILAAGLYLYDAKKMYNLIPVVNYELLKKEDRNIGDLLYDQLINKAHEKKLEFDFEGSEVPGVEKMYRRLGGRVDLKHTATKYSIVMKTIYFLLNSYNSLKRNK